MIKRFYFLLFILCVFAFSTAAKADLYVCKKGSCDWADPVKPWLLKVKSFFKTPNVRIDFCEANAATHNCTKVGLNWRAKSKLTPIYFSVPVARALPGKRTLLVDYLVSANEFLPSCQFSNTTFDIAQDQTIRIISQSFPCKLMDSAVAKIQTTFFIDYFDIDNSILGGHYVIQNAGSISGSTSGYALLRMRDGNTSLPLVATPENTATPPAPETAHTYYTPEGYRIVNGKIQQEKDISWWDKLKESLNLDKKRSRKAPPGTEPHWWDKMTNTLTKMFYLEPLD